MKVVEALFASQDLRSLTDAEFVAVTSTLCTLKGACEANLICRGLPALFVAIRREASERIRAIVERRSTHRDILRIASA